LAVFIGVRTLDSRRLVVLAQLLIGIAVLQGLLGVVQFQTAQTGEKLLYIAGSHRDSGTGTYANRNHLAGLIEMTLPLALALFFFTLAGEHQGFRSSSGWKRRVRFLGNRQGNVALAYGIVVLLLILGVVFTRSRAGISLSIVAILLSASLFSGRIGRHGLLGPAGTIAVIAVAVALAIGLAPVLERFSVQGVVNDLRFVVFAATMDGIAALFPVGSGPGTYPDVFLSFQPIETGNKWVNRAHNDYLEWIFDGGIVAMLLIVAVLALFVYQWTRVYTRGAWSQSRYLQVGAGIGLLLIGMHEVVDYNLHTPANQLVFAFLAGIFFAPPSASEEGSLPRARESRRSPNPKAPDSAAVRPTGFDPVPPNQIENPFRKPKSD
jgi:O-antigen ligase